MKPSLYVIPSNLAPNFSPDSFSTHHKDTTFSLKKFVVENTRSARRFLSQLGHPEPIHELEFRELNEHTNDDDLQDLLSFIQEHDTGLLSEAGCPGIADPGADLIAMAHENGVRVVPMIGPSSIVLALMASGLNGQCFSFNGYLNRDGETRKRQIRAFEKESMNESRTQIFIETPYRNRVLFDAFCKVLNPSTKLTIACELSSKEEWIATKTISKWKNTKINIHKKNTVFLFLA